jgi:hypothetical protein
MRSSTSFETAMTNPNLSREYLMSDALKREMEDAIERGEAVRRVRREREERRRLRLRRLSLGLLGR